MYCNGTCQYLNERKRKCELTGEKLACLKQTGSVSFTVYEHTGICEGDEEMYVDVIKSLCSLPATDLNFTADLKRATSNQIRLAIETMERNGGKNKGRIAACKRELRKRDKSDD